MKNQINIAEILKDKPEGTKLYDYLRNIEVEFDTISKTEEETVVWCLIQEEDKITHFAYSEFGKLRGCDDGLTILLPSKSMRNWSKFAWKKGDVLQDRDGNTQAIFNGFTGNNYELFFCKYWVKILDDKNKLVKETSELTRDFFKVNDELSKCYINAIEEILGGKLNMETLEIEKPMFKDGDILFINGKDFNYTIILCKDNQNSKLIDEYAAYVSLSDNVLCYVNVHNVVSFDRVINIRYANLIERRHLFVALEKVGKHWNAETKQIEDIKPKWTPKPFDKVIVRDEDSDTWVASLFSHMKGNRFVTINCSDGFGYCLPYNEKTAKLIGTTDNWEEN